MNSGDLSGPPGRLHDAWLKLQVRWQNAEESWNDPISQDFAEKILQPLTPTIMTGIERMRMLTSFLQSAMKECEE